MAMAIFDHTHPTIIETPFSFPKFIPAYKKITSFQQFIHVIQSILGFHDQTAHTHFWQCPLKMFWSTFSLRDFVSTRKKSDYFIDLFWRYGW